MPSYRAERRPEIRGRKGLESPTSEREDSNLRPPAPEAGALTKLRYVPVCGERAHRQARAGVENRTRVRCLRDSNSSIELHRHRRQPRCRSPLGKVWNLAWARPVAFGSGGEESNFHHRLMRPALCHLSYLQWGGRPDFHRCLRVHGPVLCSLSYDRSGNGLNRTTDLLLIRQVRLPLRHTPMVPRARFELAASDFAGRRSIP